MNDKKIILQIDNVRIREYDSMNVVVERLEEYTVPPRKKGEKPELSSGWKFKGYASTVLKAIEKIQRDELLSDKKSYQSLTDHLDEVKRVNELLLSEIKKVIA